MFSDQPKDNRRNIPSQNNYVVDYYLSNQDRIAYTNYGMELYSHLHNWAANAVLRNVTKNQNASIATLLVPM